MLITAWFLSLVATAEPRDDRLCVEPRSIDLGTMVAGDVARVECALTNGGEHQSSITVEAQGAWLLVPALHRRFQLEPKQKRTIVAFATPLGASASENGRLVFHSSQSQTVSFNISVSTVLPASQSPVHLRVSPEVTFLRPMNCGSLREFWLSAANPSSEPLTIEAVSLGCRIEALFDLPLEIVPRESVRLPFVWRACDTWGQQIEWIILNVRQPEAVTVLAEVRVKQEASTLSIQELEPHPESVRPGDVAQRFQVVGLAPRRESGIDVRAINDAVAVSATHRMRGVWVVEVACPPSRTDGRIEDQVRVASGSESVLLPVEFSVSSPAPAWSSSVCLGVVPLGRRVIRRVELPTTLVGMTVAEAGEVSESLEVSMEGNDLVLSLEGDGSGTAVGGHVLLQSKSGSVEGSIEWTAFLSY